MRLASIETPVQASWLPEQGFRLDPGPYISAAYAARKFLQQLPCTETLGDLAADIFYAGRFRRQWTTDPAHGVPFLGSAAIFAADLSSPSLITRNSVNNSSRLKLKPGWTLVTRSGMNAGRVGYSRLSMDGMACSEDVVRVVPNDAKIPAGYLYTVLASRYGVPVIRGGIYGTSVRHIEPRHLVDLPVPRLGSATEAQIDGLISESAALRQRFENGIVDATRDLFESTGIAQLLDLRWHEQGRDTNFSVLAPTSGSLRALNYAPRAQLIRREIESVAHRALGEICSGGALSRGSRFKRVESDSAAGVRLVNQRQGFWLRPEGRWIRAGNELPSDVMVKDETVLIAVRGTLGETEAFCHPIFVTGRWKTYAYTDDFLRVVSGTEDVPTAYLFAYLRSEAVFRMLRAMSTGSKQQDIHQELRRALPVPIASPDGVQRVANKVRAAYGARDEADNREDMAFALLDDAIREAAV